MPGPTVVAGDLNRPVALRVRSARNDIVIGSRDGSLMSLDVTTADEVPLPSAPGWIRTFDVSPDGGDAYVGGSTIGLWRLPLDGQPARQLIRSRQTPGAILADEVDHNVIILAEGGAPGRLLERTMEPSNGVVRARGLRAARGLIREQGRFIVAEAVDGGRLTQAEGNGPHTVLVGMLGNPVDLAWRDASQTKVVVADRNGRVLEVDLAHPGDPPRELYTGLGVVWAARPLDETRLAIGADRSVLVAELAPPAPTQVRLTAPVGQLFVSGWVRVAVDILDPAVRFEDLDFVVEPQHGGELVSLSRDNGFDAAHPTVLLSAGWLTGPHLLIARNRADGSEAGRSEFEVLDSWADPDVGPSFATFGSVLGGPDSGTYGGPGAGDHTRPQNVAVHPALGTRNIAVVLVQMSPQVHANAQFPMGAALSTFIGNLRNEIVNGVTIGGQVRSTAAYFDQASHGLFAINLVGIAGPITLPDTWTSYFRMNDLRQYKANPGLDSTIIAAVVAQNYAAAEAGNPPILDLSTIDTIVYVVKSRVAPPDDDLTVWPQASLTKFSQLIGTKPTPHPILGSFPVPVFRDVARIFIPDDWVSRSQASGRQVHETLAHELCHNLGLLDQYNQSYAPAIAGRITGDPAAAATNPTGAPGGTWELMAWEASLPLPSAAHRLMLGWIDEAKVKLFNFGVQGPAHGVPFELHAAGAGAPPPTRWAAAEVRVEDGRNFYIEYRPNIPGRVVDTNVPQASAVVITDALTRLPEPLDRAQILLPEEDDDNVVERGSFIVGEDYEKLDTSGALNFANLFTVDVLATTPVSATVRVKYADKKPDPTIRPWSPANDWKSPDLEIVNARGNADPTFRNVPWEGHDNALRAVVHNAGLVDAHGVNVQFVAKDFTFGGGDEIQLGFATHDIPAGGDVTFVAPQVWRPGQLRALWEGIGYEQHACVIARIQPFFDDVADVWEVTTENNEAQSNYTWVASTSRSPATRELTTVLVDNPFETPAIVAVAVRQPHPLFRVFLDHRWVRLEPGAQRRIAVMIESLLGDPTYDEITSPFNHHDGRIETTLRLSAYADTGASCAGALTGGVAILAMTGLATHFEEFETNGDHARGYVVQSDSGAGVSGLVLVTVGPLDPTDPVRELVVEAQAVEGQFLVDVGRLEARSVTQAHYIGHNQWMPSDSDKIEEQL